MSALLSDQLQTDSEEDTVHSDDLSSPGRDSEDRDTSSLSPNGVICCNQDEGSNTKTQETLNSCSVYGDIDSFQLKQTSSSILRHDQTTVGFRHNETPTVRPTTGATLRTNENQAADEVSEHSGNAKIIDANVSVINCEAQENPSHGENLTDSLDNCRLEGVAVSDVERSETRTKTAPESHPSTKTEASVGTESEKKGGEQDSRQRTFDPSAIENETKELLRRALSEVRYEPNTCKVIGHQLAGKILKRIIRLCPKRYKLVIFVSIGSLCDRPGIQFGSRCLWDADTDILATARYANDTLFAVAMVYALCTD